jgi:hypothetical protein
MDPASMGFTQKMTAPAAISLVILSFLGLLYFVSISTFSLLTGTLSPYWHGCFLLCSIALGGWIILYSAQLRLGGGAMIFLNNLLLVWSLIFAVLISIFTRFVGQQRYIAVLVLALSLVAFHIAVPGMTTPATMIWLLKNRRAQSSYGPHSHKMSER